MVNRMRVVFLGTPNFAVPSLQALLDSPYEVCAVFTQPDRPAGRGHALHAPPVKELALRAGIEVHQPEKIRHEENRALIAPLSPDFLVVVAYGQILPGCLLGLPRIGPVNVHASLLPLYRGAAPVTWAILNGDTVTGITTMLMDEGMDTGPMLLRREVAISPTVTGGDLMSELATVGAELLIPTLDGLAAGTISATPQDDTGATLAPRIRKEMGEIDWRQNARAIHDRVRALHPWPFAFTTFQGQRMQVLRSLPAACDAGIADLEPGTFVGLSGQGMLVACGGNGVIELLEVQLESRKRVLGRDLAVGARLRSGDRILGPAASGERP